MRKRGPWDVIRRDASIANTERSIIDTIIDCCNVLGIKHTVTYATRKNPAYKPIWNVNFNSRASFEALYRLPLGSAAKKERLRKLIDTYKHTVLDAQEISRRYLAGETMRAIADSLGVHYGRIQVLLKREGVTTRCK